ncbi:uncharacterized protein LOC104901877 [Beta vulgaris subsp. vulgaris]|uniref:uncharacterized protein LOC104901877 n=1 Tax=Beta vulgaris subsp. vulgaris TaxID=3555 RepID=UPI002036D512|nr:uncharacterized protein LOC104901877 [Beta vulgaris subsp. vulgaris]
MLLHSIANLYQVQPLSPSKSSHLYGFKNYSPCPTFFRSFSLNNLEQVSTLRWPFGISSCCRARRRIRYVDEEEDDEHSSGYNEEIAMLEMYSQSARGEALLVTAMVDDQEVEVLIFKGFSSCLSYGTSPDASKSVIPQRAIIKFIDRIKGPFNPANIEYIEKGLTLETFKSRYSSN